jgi:hypothetical protein
MDEGFCGGDRAAQDIGDLLIGEVLLPAEDDCGALVFWEKSEGLFDAFFEFGEEASVGRAGSGGIFEVVMEGIVVLVGWAGIERFGWVAAASAQFVEAEITGDGVEPGGESGCGAVPSGGLVHLHENILREILGFLQIADHAVNQIHDGLFVFFDQGFEGGTVAALNAQH